MTNEMKLLLAFIEASGYEVEEEYKVYVSGVYIRTQDHEEEHKPGNQFPVRNEVDYKVTKKEFDILSRNDVTPVEMLERERDLQRKTNLILSFTAERNAQEISFYEYHKAMKDLGL